LHPPREIVVEYLLSPTQVQNIKIFFNVITYQETIRDEVVEKDHKREQKMVLMSVMPNL
jgi:hypothetical protein